MYRIAIVSVLTILAATAVTRASDQPNILFIMSDDHCSQAIGAYGGRLASLNPTPTLDRLAKEGMLFENASCTNSICSPSRACILTGQYAHTNGAYDLGGRVETGRQYLAQEMKKAGYHTAMVGKWHLKEEPGAFDYYCVLPGQGKYFDPEFRVQGDQPWPRNTVNFDGKHSTDAITDITLQWLKDGWDQKKPFFLMHHYKAPHDFFQFAPRYEEYLADVAIPEPENLWSQPNFGSIATRGADDELLPFIGTSIGRRNPRRNYTQKWAKDASLSDEQATRIAYNTYMQWYLRCVKGVDDNLARLFAYLKETGELDNTVIMYTGDQGFMLGEHDYMDKRWMYDESMRMPLLVRYPAAIPANSRTDAIVENVDFGPTMLAFAGIEKPKYMQGRSFHSICMGNDEPKDWKQAAYYRYWMHMAHHDNPGHVGIRTKDFKLIFYYGCNYEGQHRTPPGWELYDLRTDPTEVVNQYDNPEYATIVAELKDQLAALRAEVGDDGKDFPAVETIIQEFWDYDEADRAKAVEISHAYRASKYKPVMQSQLAKTTPDGWILPAESSATLRKREGAVEVSRDATYKIFDRGNSGFNVDNAYLLSGDSPPVKPHAFHSEEMEQPYIIIKLSRPSSLRFFGIKNRETSDKSLLQRAAGLTLWLSTDGERWQEAWQAEEPQPEWNVELDPPPTAQFIKLGLKGSGILHLNQVIAFE